MPTAVSTDTADSADSAHSADTAATVTDALTMMTTELTIAAAAVSDVSAEALEASAQEISGARRVFVLGAGRSGLALRMTAMRLMHLGLEAHIVGDATTPAIGEGDLLLVASGSGTTSSIVSAAEKTVEVGGVIVAITTDPDSTLGRLATHTIVVPAAKKLERDSTVSQQYAGGLFEQAVVLIGDALFHSLWKRSGQSADDLWPRHSNIE
ncbi:MAG: 3-hexulose-6-phosphate isomerase [Glaciihabitans sp.]|nr:3-hexulose-6-phosphate isomerase [Glaciihabitans sp.]